jgi:ppGpp synthetase/RelA/SpoT-type nucleotidyltranferase
VDAGWSKSRISRLGKALISASPPPAESLKELHELLIVYDAALDVAIARIREHVNVQLTSRLKNTGTILEKLRRSGGGSLGNVQDLAGIRIVLDCDLAEQIRFARRIEKLFSSETRPPKIADKRLEGMRGYRAVHVIATVEGRPVEIQIRTRLQHQWANLFEKFADIVGRGIRYGEPPDEWTVLFDLDFESWARTEVEPTMGVQAITSRLQRGKSMVDLIIDSFTSLSDDVRTCEVAATFYGNPEDLEQSLIIEEVPSLEEVEQKREGVLESARLLEVISSQVVNRRQLYTPMVDMAKRLASGAAAAGAELDRERLRAELRKRVLGVDFSSPGDDADLADGEDSER